MKTRIDPFANRNRWLNRPVNSGAYRHWLIGRDSLTKKLQLKVDQFAVCALSLKNAKPRQDEALSLGLVAHEYALLREVLLVGDAVPLVFAHSVLPHKSLRGPWRGLSRLGNQPLGAALFADPQVTRTTLQYQKITKQHALYHQAALHLAQPPTAFWARRSIFQLNTAFNRHAIMVTEVFLPAVLSLDKR